METQTQVIELAEKDIKVVIMSVFHMFRKLSRDIEDIKKSQIKILEFKTAVTEIEIIILLSNYITLLL